MRRIASGMLLTLFLASLLILKLDFHPANAIGTIYIRSNGSIDPPTAPIRRNGDIFSLIGDIESAAAGITIERDNIVLDGAGYKIQGAGNENEGIIAVERSNITIKNVKVRGFFDGIFLHSGSNCKITKNEITANNDHGIVLLSSHDNTVTENIASMNLCYGILLYVSSYNNNVTHNDAKANRNYGIVIEDSCSNNNIESNDITNGNIGIYLGLSYSNIIFNNNVENNNVGIILESCSGNKIFHNNFTSNGEPQTSIVGNEGSNYWDDGYPSGGNFWSDYAGKDLFTGPDQNETGSDGIGDTPYQIDENNIDRYPFARSRTRPTCSVLERQIAGLVNGSRAYDYDLGLEQIAYDHYAFRSGGSEGATEAAYWIKARFESFGLETRLEPFEFVNWTLLSKPSLIVDDDGDLNTTADQTEMRSFQSTHLSFPTPEDDVFAHFAVLPLPIAANLSEVGSKPINQTEWNGVNTTGKIVLAGAEVRLPAWEATFVNKITAQPPSAIVYTIWYDWKSWIPDSFGSSAGCPLSDLGKYCWDLRIPTGFINYQEGAWIRSRENVPGISGRLSIRSVIGNGTHYNVVAKIAGYLNPEKMVIISAHYDTVTCSGFGDNGAGTAGVMELANIFADAIKTGIYRPSNTLLFIEFADEELGLVGSVNYVRQHKADMPNTVAVINLDCIGSDDLRVTKTATVNGFNLAEVVLDAAQDVGIVAELELPGGSDQDAFLRPREISDWYRRSWSVDGGISDAVPVASSAMLISYPLSTSDKWNMGKPGWIHTSYDNSTSTATLDWIDIDDLGNHIKTAALTVMRVSPPFLPTDLNADGVVNIQDITTVAIAYNSQLGDLEWNELSDLDKSGLVNIIDITLVAKDYGKTV